MNSTSPHSKRLGSNPMNARGSGSTTRRRSGVCSGNQSSHRLSVCVVSPRNDEHFPIAHGLLDRCRSISASTSRFVVEFNISSFVMYNHPPIHTQAPQCPSMERTDNTHFRSYKRPILESWYCIPSRITDRSDGLFLLPRFLKLSRRTNSRVFLSSPQHPSSQCRARIFLPLLCPQSLVMFPCTSQIPTIAPSYHPHAQCFGFLINFHPHGLFLQKISRKQINSRRTPFAHTLAGVFNPIRRDSKPWARGRSRTPWPSTHDRGIPRQCGDAWYN